MSKITLTAAAAAGYVFGARAGRQRFEQIAAGARRVSGNPRVQKVTTDAQNLATQKVGQVAPVVKAKVVGAARTVMPSSSSSSSASESMESSAESSAPPAAPPSPTSVTPPVSPSQPATTVPLTGGGTDDTVGGPA
jgi:hypothetical protein